MSEKITPSYPISIFVAGDLTMARHVCGAFCNVGLCVTVTPTDYVYLGGMESGVIVGLINYPCFPAEPRTMRALALELADRLIAELHQLSATVQTPDETIWISNRPEDQSKEIA